MVEKADKDRKNFKALRKPKQDTLIAQRSDGLSVMREGEEKAVKKGSTGRAKENVSGQRGMRTILKH